MKPGRDGRENLRDGPPSGDPPLLPAMKPGLNGRENQLYTPLHTFTGFAAMKHGLYGREHRSLAYSGAPVASPQ